MGGWWWALRKLGAPLGGEPAAELPPPAALTRTWRRGWAAARTPAGRWLPLPRRRTPPPCRCPAAPPGTRACRAWLQYRGLGGGGRQTCLRAEQSGLVCECGCTVCCSATQRPLGWGKAGGVRVGAKPGRAGECGQRTQPWAGREIQEGVACTHRSTSRPAPREGRCTCSTACPSRNPGSRPCSASSRGTAGGGGGGGGG